MNTNRAASVASGGGTGWVFNSSASAGACGQNNVHANENKKSKPKPSQKLLCAAALLVFIQKSPESPSPQRAPRGRGDIRRHKLQRMRHQQPVLYSIHH